jgi:hypothetical protein
LYLKVKVKIALVGWDEEKIMKNKNKDDLPEWGIPFYEDKFTGPYWSDGAWQSSVADSTRIPTSKLEGLSKRHDAAFATARDDFDLLAADLEYYEQTRSMGFIPRLVGELPIMFNQFGKSDEYRRRADLGVGKIKDKNMEKMKFVNGQLNLRSGETSVDTNPQVYNPSLRGGEANGKPPTTTAPKSLTPSTYDPYADGQFHDNSAGFNLMRKMITSEKNQSRWQIFKRYGKTKRKVYAC